MTSEKLARRIAAIADAKKAEGIVALDMRQLVAYTDFLVVCTARSERQVKSVHDDVYVKLKRDERLTPDHVEGLRESQWVLMDYLDCVLHVFTAATRERYRLETLWGEAPRLELRVAGAA